MKILFVNNFRGRGGGEEFLRDLLPGLVKRGVGVGLICRPTTPLFEMFKDSDIRLFPTDRSGLNGILSVFRIARIIRQEGYQIISIQRGHDIVQSWTGAFMSFRKPMLIYTVQVAEFIRSRYLLGRMDRITTISRYIADKLTAFVPAMEKQVSILYYGIDLKRFSGHAPKKNWLKERLGLPLSTVMIGSVGDLWKNQIEFLDALAEVRRVSPAVCFVMVAAESGIGQVQEFKARAEQMGLSGAVRFTGRLSKEDMVRFYEGIDIAVSTHRNEGFGIWVLEALAMGRPVVAFNAGGIRDSLEGCPAGVLVNSPREMATEITRILGDTALWENMVSQGPQWVTAKFSRERMIEDYYRYFSGCLDGADASVVR